MRFRFLYLNDAGEEVEVGGLDELRTAVAMGRVAEGTLLYDAVTHEWAPARAHSAYRELMEEPDDRVAEPAISEVPKMSPVREPDVPDPVSVFVEEEERRRAAEGVEEAKHRPDNLQIMDGTGELADRANDPVRPPSRSFDGPPEPDTRPAAPRITRRRAGRGSRRLLMAVGTVVLLGTVWAVAGDRGGAEAGDLPAASGDGVAAAGATPQGGELAALIAEAEGSAFQDMVVAMDSLQRLHGLAGGPGEWLDGHYLATASAYPHVPAYWRRYQDFVAELRASDTALFRNGFVQRLRSEGFEGPVLSMRLARGLEGFDATQPARDSLYAGMESLAATALELHALLVEREDDVEYDPVRAGTVSRDPVVEAFPRYPELQNRIWQLLDRIFISMDVVQGGVPGSREQLADAPLREILDSSGAGR